MTPPRDRERQRRAPLDRAGAAACGLTLVLASACATSPAPQAPADGADASAAIGFDDAAPRDTSPPTALEAALPPVDADEPETTSPNEAAALAEGSSPAHLDASQDATSLAVPDGSAPPAGQGAALESVVVPVSGSVTFHTTLARGGAYLLKGIGTVNVAGTDIDAEFGGFDAAGNGAMDVVAGLDVGIDIGLMEIHPMNHTTIVPPGPGRMKWYGGFRKDHTYYMWITGTGAPLTVRLAAPASAGADAAAGPGGMSVSIFELAPPPPAIFQPMPGPMPAPPAAPKLGQGAIDTVYVPVQKNVVQSKISTNKAAVYLLQVSGTAICGGGGLQMGDADYMDWTAAGAGFNDGEGGVDFGLGVDELNVGHGAGAVGGGYAHRLLGWGPFRNDHVYFMLYAGTGNPLSFVYWDVAYGDNSTTQSLTVSIFAVP